MSDPIFPLPGVQHGQRVIVSAIESRTRSSTDKPWVSVPVNEQDLSQGHRDISFRQLNNYANHAVRWLSDSLAETSKPFQCFAYAGPKDLRYPILAVAAAKLQKVVWGFCAELCRSIPSLIQARWFSRRLSSRPMLRSAFLIQRTVPSICDRPRWRIKSG